MFNWNFGDKSFSLRSVLVLLFLHESLFDPWCTWKDELNGVGFTNFWTYFWNLEISIWRSSWSSSFMHELMCFPELLGLCFHLATEFACVIQISYEISNSAAWLGLSPNAVVWRARACDSNLSLVRIRARELFKTALHYSFFLHISYLGSIFIFKICPNFQKSFKIEKYSNWSPFFCIVFLILSIFLWSSNCKLCLAEKIFCPKVFECVYMFDLALFDST